MNFFSLIHVEFKKIRRSKILLLLLAAVIILWVPSILNASVNFNMQDIGISPENNFLIQGFLGMSWFLFPASMVACTVLLNQTERGNNGILKMLALPVNTAKLCIAKFTVLLSLAAAQILMSVGMYFISAAIASQTQHYPFLLSPTFVLKEAGLIFLASVPMITFFQALSVCIRTPVFSVGIGLASIVPSVLMINTKAWFAWPMSYPLFIITSEYGKLASSMDASRIEWIPWIPVAAIFTVVCFLLSCFCFGRAERR